MVDAKAHFLEAEVYGVDNPAGNKKEYAESNGERNDRFLPNEGLAKTIDRKRDEEADDISAKPDEILQAQTQMERPSVQP